MLSTLSKKIFNLSDVICLDLITFIKTYLVRLSSLIEYLIIFSKFELSKSSEICHDNTSGDNKFIIIFSSFIFFFVAFSNAKSIFSFDTFFVSIIAFISS